MTTYAPTLAQIPRPHHLAPARESEKGYNLRKNGPLARLFVVLRCIRCIIEGELPEKRKEKTMGDEVLVVGSKVRGYIKAKAGMNTSAAVIGALSVKVAGLLNEAIENAKKDGRKTVLDRDVQ
jgi:histone H3/H4